MNDRKTTTMTRRGEFKMEKLEGASEKMKFSETVGCSQVSLSERMPVR